jgi:nucleotide-binding universal stress UspA family protein
MIFHQIKSTMKRILVPTDFSQCASFAADTAIKMAKKSNSEVHFLHFMSIPIHFLQMESGQDKVFPELNAEVEEVKSDLQTLVDKAHKAGVQSEYFLSFNESSSNIIKHIQEQMIDLVVMGSHGASGVRELFIGSNAQRIVRLSPVPVLILKQEFDNSESPSIAFVSDFESEAIKPFEQLLNFANLLDAKVNLVYINTPAYFVDSWEIERRMESFKFMASSQLDKSQIIDAYVFEDGLKRYTEEQQNPIMAMATHGRHGISRVFYGSVTEKAVNHLEVPILSLKINHQEREVYLEAMMI